MACCAFAVFLIGQIVYGLHALWNRLRGVAADEQAFAADRAAAWRPGATIALPALNPARRVARPVLVAAVAIELLVLATGGIALSRQHDAVQDLAILCRAVSLRTAFAGGAATTDLGEFPR